MGKLRIKVKSLVSLYKKNIRDNNSRLKLFKGDPKMQAKLKGESKCLSEVVEELEEALK